MNTFQCNKNKTCLKYFSIPGLYYDRLDVQNVELYNRLNSMANQPAHTEVEIKKVLCNYNPTSISS